MKWLLIFVFIILPVLGQTQDFSVDELTDENLCLKIHDLQSSQPQTKASKEIRKLKRDLLFSRIFPKKYFMPKVEHIVTRYEDSVIKGKDERSVILSVGGDQHTHQHIDEFLKLEKELKKQSKTFLKILKQKAISKCEKIKAKKKFSLKKYKEFKLQLNELNKFHLKEYLEINRELKKYVKKNSHWAIQYNLHFDDLNTILKEGKFENILVVVHAKSNGFLIDNYKNIIPMSVFKNIHSAVRNLGVVSCYNDKALEKYNIVQELQKSEGFEDKAVFGIQSKLKEQEQKTMIRALPVVLKTFDKVRKTQNFNFLNSRKKDQCLFQVSGNVEGGVIGLFLDDKDYIGKFSDGSKSIKVNCDRVGEDMSLSIRALDQSDIKGINIEILFNGEKVELVDHFFAPSYQGSLFFF